MVELHKVLTITNDKNTFFTYSEADGLYSIFFLSKIGKHAGIHYDPEDQRVAHIYIDADGKSHIDLLSPTSTPQDLFIFIMNEVA